MLSLSCCPLPFTCMSFLHFTFVQEKGMKGDAGRVVIGPVS